MREAGWNWNDLKFFLLDRLVIKPERSNESTFGNKG
jgi:hypothetical protein